MNRLLYILEFVILGVLVNFSLGEPEQMMSSFNETPSGKIISKFLFVCIITMTVSAFINFLRYLNKKNDKTRILRQFLCHVLFILMITALLLSIQYYKCGYV